MKLHTHHVDTSAEGTPDWAEQAFADNKGRLMSSVEAASIFGAVKVDVDDNGLPIAKERPN